MVDDEYWVVADAYIPSQVDRKKAVFMYILLWIFIYLSKNWKEKTLNKEWNNELSENVYMSYHVRQSIWIRTVIFVSLPVLLLFSFVPFFRYFVSFLLFLLEIIILVYFIKMAWEWKYQQWKKSGFVFFHKLWDWILELFD